MKIFKIFYIQFFLIIINYNVSYALSNTKIIVKVGSEIITSYELENKTLHKIISGSDGSINGNAVYDSNKIGLIGGLTGFLFGAAWVMGGPVTAITTTLARTLVPAAVIGSVSKLVSSDSADSENRSNTKAIIHEKKKHDEFKSGSSDTNSSNHSRYKENKNTNYQQQCPHEEEKVNRKFEKKFNKHYKSTNKKSNNRTKTEQEYADSYFNGNYDYSYSGKQSRSWGKERSSSSWHRTNTTTMSKEVVDNLRLLGIDYSENIDKVIIKKYYYKSIKKWHPDVYSGDPEIGRKMSRQINVAYDNLKKIYK